MDDTIRRHTEAVRGAGTIRSHVAITLQPTVGLGITAAELCRITLHPRTRAGGHAITRDAAADEGRSGLALIDRQRHFVTLLEM